MIALGILGVFCLLVMAASALGYWLKSQQPGEPESEDDYENEL